MIPEILTPAAFEEAFKAQLESEITVYPSRSWYPSQIAHPCDRFLVWSWTRWQDRRRHDWVLQSIFDEGHLHAPAMYARLEKMGLQIIRESDRPVQYRTHGAVISGRPDGKVTGYKGERFPEPVILELKTTQQHVFDQLDTIEDIKTSRTYYVRGYFDQGNLYCLLEELKHGVLVLKSKGTGLLKVIPFELDFEAAEALLKRVERLQPMVEARQDPEAIPYRSDVCGRCPFGAMCYPPRSMGEGALLIEDAELVELIETMERTDEAASEYDAAKRKRNKLLERHGLKQKQADKEVLAMVGNYLITTSSYGVKGFSVAARVDTIYEIRKVEVGQ